jgi:hypothetical protein
MLREQNIELLNARFTEGGTLCFTKGGTLCFKLLLHGKLCLWFVVEEWISVKLLIT